ncbi:MAG: hypothetical protein Q4E83_06885 [bacterium]|nr:hypothetical protein [bacterium]
MAVKSTRKELVSIGLNPQDADVLRKYAEAQCRSLSEVIRMIVREFINQSKLHQRYQNK